MSNAHINAFRPAGHEKNICFLLLYNAIQEAHWICMFKIEKYTFCWYCCWELYCV